MVIFVNFFVIFNYFGPIKVLLSSYRLSESCESKFESEFESQFESQFDRECKSKFESNFKSIFESIFKSKLESMIVSLLVFKSKFERKLEFVKVSFVGMKLRISARDLSLSKGFRPCFSSNFRSQE